MPIHTNSMLRNHSIPSFFILCCCLVLAFSSCKRDKCKKVVCDNGQCVDGECVCPSGYEGIACADPVNAKFEGSYAAEESCTAGDDTYDLEIALVENSVNSITISGLWDEPAGTVNVEIADNGLDLTISRQSYAGMEIEGEGTIGASFESGNITYRMYQTGASTAFDQCSLTYQ
jgi:hypothetical protein